MTKEISLPDIEDAVESLIRGNGKLRDELFHRNGFSYGRAVQVNLTDGLLAEIDRRRKGAFSGLFDVRRRVRCYGLDHVLKLMIPSGTVVITPGAHWVFVEVFVPHVIDAFLSIVKSSSDRSKFVFVTTDPRVERYVEKSSSVRVARISFRNARYGDLRAAIKMSRSLLAEWRNWRSDPRRQFPGAVMSERRFIERVFQINMMSLPFFRSLFLNMLKELSPRGILVGCDGFAISRALLGTARNLGISTSVLQHGLIAGNAGYFPLMADRIFVWSKMEKKWFVKKGTPSRRVLVTGSPKFDVPRVVRTNQEGLSIMVASTPIFLEEALNLYRASGEISRDLGFPHRMKFRAHPFFKGKIKTALTSAGLLDPAIPLDSNPLEVSLCDTDVVVSNISTLAIEASSRGIPVIVLEDHKNAVSSEVYKIPSCVEPGAVVRLLREIAEKKRKNRLVARKINQRTIGFSIPQGGGKRIAALIEGT